jgi:hypothetical protein
LNVITVAMININQSIRLSLVFSEIDSINGLPL